MSSARSGHYASDELVLVAVIALVAIGSFLYLLPQDDVVTGQVVIAERESTLPSEYNYQGALQRGKLPVKTGGCAVCASGTLRPKMSQVFSLCTGDYAVRLTMVGSLQGNVLFDVNGELFQTAAGSTVSLRDGMQVNVKEVNKKDGQQMMSFALGALSYTTTLKPGDSRHISLCDTQYDITINSFDFEPKTVSLTVNKQDFVLAAGEARVLSSGKTLSILRLDAKQDRVGSVSIEIA